MFKFIGNFFMTILIGPFWMAWMIVKAIKN